MTHSQSCNVQSTHAPDISNDTLLIIIKEKKRKANDYLGNK